MILKYSVQRLLMIIPVSLAISVVIFLIVHLLPGDPIDNLIRVGSSPEDRIALTAKYGLDRSLIEQYFLWIGQIMTGDFGQAIVLRRQTLGEADRILTLYTPDYGKLKVVAKGVLKPQSRKAGHVELFARSDVLIARGRSSLDVLSQAELIDSFPPIRRDLVRTTYAAHFVAAFVEELKQRSTTPGIVFSINIPKSTEAETAGVAVAPMAGIHLTFAYEELERDPEGRRFRPRIGLATEAPAGGDTEAFMRDMITVTPLQFDWTAYSTLDDLGSWGLSHQVAR